MKQSIGETGDQADISDISRIEIWIKWKENKRPAQIAEETCESVLRVHRALTQMQKTLTRKMGVNHVRRRPRRGGF